LNNKKKHETDYLPKFPGKFDSMKNRWNHLD